VSIGSASGTHTGEIEDFGRKVLGRPIEVSCGSSELARSGSSIARQWIKSNGVNMIVNIRNPAVGLVVEK
jgi:hypothetical protein